MQKIVLEQKSGHAPNLNTILMIENSLKNSGKTPVSIAELKRILPKQVNHNTLMAVLEYLEESSKIVVSLKGIAWACDDNSKARQVAGNSIGRIKSKIIQVLRKHNMKKAALFGSISRGELREDSDIDILVEFKGNQSLFDAAGLKLELEESLKRRVDLVTYNSLHPLLKKRILKEQQVLL